MTPLLVSIVIVLYFASVLFIAHRTSRGADSETFFNANKSAPWYLVAFGMVGASLSGVTFISVPGAVGTSSFGYMQMVIGYMLGYFIIAVVLMPLYYRLRLISIYSYLETRFGFFSYKTGAAFFLLSRTTGASFRLFLVANVLQLFLFDSLGIPFEVTVFLTIALIWLYTFRGGIKTIIFTDTLQTLFMLVAVGVTIVMIASRLDYSPAQVINAVTAGEYSQLFFWDATKGNYFFKQFFAGAFIALTMTGLDQDMMQKNLSCATLKEAQKNMLWFSVALLIVNFFFLALGALLYIYAGHIGLEMPERSDDLYPILAGEHLGTFTGLVFLLGVIAAAYSSADSALTSLTTSFCIDFLDFEKKTDSQRSEHEKKKTRVIVHLSFSAVLLLVIVIFGRLNDKSVIHSLFTLAGYTYGPLLGLYAFGLLTKLQVRDRFVPFLCIAAPIIGYVLSANSEEWFNGYAFSYELIIIIGLITFLGMAALSTGRPKESLTSDSAKNHLN